MNLKDLFLKTRTCRRFDEAHQISQETLENLVDLARLSASGGNRQPLKYLLYNSPQECERIFPHLAWAAYLKDWSGPVRGERPSAYIVILGDKSLADNFGVDHGIAAHSIMLGAVNEGLGGCIIASIKREELCDDLKIPDHYEILFILAIGKPVETIIIDEIKDGDVKYWRDAEGGHHVPKRNLNDLILRL
ncbi:MAG: nitroreductase family protein [Bacteroidales bacterium]|nr:nitroreductase family protein [Bacteroidales bacterium]